MPEIQFDEFIKKTPQNFTPIESFNLVLYKKVSVSEKISALFQLLKFYYNPNTLNSEEASFIMLSPYGLAVLFFNKTPRLHYNWMEQTFSFRKTHFTAMVHTFYCVQLHNMMQITYVLLHKENFSLGQTSNEQLIHPCFVDDFEHVFHPFHHYNMCMNKLTHVSRIDIVGRYDFEKCVKLLNLAINYPELCGENIHCNFSMLKEEVLAEPISSIVFHNKFLTLSEQKKSAVLNTLLQQRDDSCFVKGLTNITLLFIKSNECFHLHLMYTILNHKYFLNENTMVSVKEMSYRETTVSWAYLLVDPYYGSILSDETFNMKTFELEASPETTILPQLPALIIPPTLSESSTFTPYESSISSKSACLFETSITAIALNVHIEHMETIMTTATAIPRESSCSLLTTSDESTTSIFISTIVSSLLSDSPRIHKSLTVESIGTAKFIIPPTKNIPFKISVGSLGAFIAITLVTVWLIYFKYNYWDKWKTTRHL